MRGAPHRDHRMGTGIACPVGITPHPGLARNVAMRIVTDAHGSLPGYLGGGQPIQIIVGEALRQGLHAGRIGAGLKIPQHVPAVTEVLQLPRREFRQVMDSRRPVSSLNSQGGRHYPPATSVSTTP